MQTIGRAARNVNAKVILYADRVTDSMQRAIEETRRRRELQEAYNRQHEAPDDLAPLRDHGAPRSNRRRRVRYGDIWSENHVTESKSDRPTIRRW